MLPPWVFFSGSFVASSHCWLVHLLSVPQNTVQKLELFRGQPRRIRERPRFQKPSSSPISTPPRSRPGHFCPFQLIATEDFISRYCFAKMEKEITDAVMFFSINPKFFISCLHHPSTVAGGAFQLSQDGNASVCFRLCRGHSDVLLGVFVVSFVFNHSTLCL